MSKAVSHIFTLLPGLVLCAGVTVAAIGLQAAEVWIFGRAWLESLVLSILIGVAVRTAWTPGEHWCAGIDFGARTLLEVAVMLLGASLSMGSLLRVGPELLAGIVAVVAVAIAVSYGIGRMLGLRHRIAVLIACGNSICGNSAIAAAAPVIGADGDDVATSIAFTAVLGVLVVLTLPLLASAFGLSDVQYGVLAGLTVYAVPQVLAATAPVAALSVQIGTLVKLVRVLMLGPVVLVLSLTAGTGRPTLRYLVPWFIVGFLGLAALRSLGFLPDAVLEPVVTMAGGLTTLSMAALGLGVDIRVVARAGMRVMAVVTVSLLALTAISLGLIGLLGPAL